MTGCPLTPWSVEFLHWEASDLLGLPFDPSPLLSLYEVIKIPAQFGLVLGEHFPLRYRYSLVLLTGELTIELGFHMHF